MENCQSLHQSSIQWEVGYQKLQNIFIQIFSDLLGTVYFNPANQSQIIVKDFYYPQVIVKLYSKELVVKLYSKELDAIRSLSVLTRFYLIFLRLTNLCKNELIINRIMGCDSLISELWQSNDWTDNWVWTMFPTCLWTFVR